MPERMTPNSTVNLMPDARRLLFNVAAGLLGTGVVLAALLALVNDPAWWRGFVAASIVSLLAASASVLPLIWGTRHGLMPAVAGYFASAGLRAVVSLGGCALAVLKGGYPRTPTMLLMVVFYFALLAVESATMARALWSAKA